jgi:zinc ribbon protein
MVCPKCQANVSSDSNFCPRCGTPFKKQSGFVANLWRDNKPGFLILSLLLVAMLGSIAYFLYSRTGKFVVTVQSVSADEAVDLYTKVALEVYCREFVAECQEGNTKKIGTEIKRVIPTLFRDNAGGYARISYYNGTGAPITATRFKYRQPPEPWREGNSRTYYQPKIDQLRAILLRGGALPFEQMVDLALTIATVEHSVPFTLQSGESKTWCLINERENRERQIEYAQNGKIYQTPILRQNQT